jgi:glycerate 2-kinase
VLRAAIDGVDAGGLVQRAIEDPIVVSWLHRARAVDVIAAGKAAAVMLNAFAAVTAVPPRYRIAIGASRPELLPVGTEFYKAGHPLPTDGSVQGARRALDVAAEAQQGDLIVVLLSGGGSALMALPADGITLADKQQTARLLMEHGADIYELNTVRKHLSAIKGGQLSVATQASVLTLVVSDVVGDDLSVIASGPTFPDDSTFDQALEVIARRGGESVYPAGVIGRLRQGVRGDVPETPKTGDPRMARSRSIVIGPQRGAIEGARRAAEERGYHVHVVDEPVTGEAREAGVAHVARIAALVPSLTRPACIIASGETTVTVTGRGKGGRNQEFAFAMAAPLGELGERAVAASIGTDGIDGPTDAAGALVDPDTFARARAAGIFSPDDYLRENNTYVFFDRLGDLIRTGPTSTNVGDLQVVLIA